MENLNSYIFKTENAESYKILAGHIAVSSVRASLYPELLSIVVTIREDQRTELDDIIDFIEDRGLSFLSDSSACLSDLSPDELTDDPTTPNHYLQYKIKELISENARAEELNTSLQTRIDVCEKNLKDAMKSRDFYQKMWNETETKLNRIEDAVRAFRTLLSAVVE
ncbi:MAG: hypothetical protein K2M59_03630 [Muribaculaceae bacterium]|nr:hypothetical protein [Muribaculaceae bacterium]MDE7465503.1 hypothetical protein [Muribaculaceae bacterium]